MLRNKRVAYPFEEYPKNTENTAEKSILFWVVAAIAITALILSIFALGNSNNLYDRNAADRFASDVQQVQLDSLLMRNSTTYGEFPTTTLYPVDISTVLNGIHLQLVERIDSPAQTFATWGPDGDFSAQIHESGTYCIGFQYGARLDPEFIGTIAISGSITAFLPSQPLLVLEATDLISITQFSFQIDSSTRFGTVPFRFTVTDVQIPVKLDFSIQVIVNSPSIASTVQVYGSDLGVGGTIPGENTCVDYQDFVKNK